MVSFGVHFLDRFNETFFDSLSIFRLRVFVINRNFRDSRGLPLSSVNLNFNVNFSLNFDWKPSRQLWGKKSVRLIRTPPMSLVQEPGAAKQARGYKRGSQKPREVHRLPGVFCKKKEGMTSQTGRETFSKGCLFVIKSGQHSLCDGNGSDGVDGLLSSWENDRWGTHMNKNCSDPDSTSFRQSMGYMEKILGAP